MRALGMILEEISLPIGRLKNWQGARGNLTALFFRDEKLRHRLMARFFNANLIRRINIDGLGSYETERQAKWNGPMVGGRRTTKVGLEGEGLVFYEMNPNDNLSFPLLWSKIMIISLAAIKEIKIEQVPVGIWHLLIILR